MLAPNNSVFADTQWTASEQAATDSLTGLANRRGFFDIGKYLLALATRLGHEVKALYVDVEGLSEYNKRHGIPAGDRALIEIAQALRASFRESDVIARVGGDEFCVLLSTSADSRLESRLQRLDEHLQLVHAERLPELRFSIGIAAVTYNRFKHNSIEQLMADAKAQIRQRN